MWLSTKLDCTYGSAILSAVQQKEQDKVVSTTYRITKLLQLLERHLKFNLCLLALPRESLGYTTLMGVQT